MSDTTTEGRLLEKLERLEALDRRREIFGAGGPHGHGYRRAPCLSAWDLATLELCFNVVLPEELRRFLTRVHGGGAGPGYGLFVNRDEKRLVRRARPFPLDESVAKSIAERRRSRSEPYASAEMPDDDDDDWPPGPGFVPIAHHGCGVFDVVVVSGSQRGLVWCCDTTWCPVFDYETGEHLSVFAWYERWLDTSVRNLAAR